MLRNRTLSTYAFASWAGVLCTLLFHFPFFRFVLENSNYHSLSGAWLVLSLVLVMIVANSFAFHLFLSLWEKLGKALLVISFLINSIALYFINTYGVIIDESMIGNVFNTNYSESSSYFSGKMVLYVLFLGVLPSIFFIRAKLEKSSLKNTLRQLGGGLLFLVVMAFLNAPNWLWIDKHSKQLGGLAMPWSYAVNTALFHIHKAQANQKEILLPDATISNPEKSVVVLVIGESARRENFSLYGYRKNTNPLLSQTPNLMHYLANSCATYTTAGVKCILEPKESSDLYEILPNYLYRHGVEVIWRTSNWGEPPVHINDYQTASELRSHCQGEDCPYDGVLLSGLKEKIQQSPKNKILVVLHTSTSHGPSYNEKYPPQFEVFRPVCQSVELSQCSEQELLNAYDNTIVYTDYLLHSVIQDLQTLKGYQSMMLYVSDHGESLGEKNLYMHGLPMSFAPKQQYEIPFLVWYSNPALQLKPLQEVSQHYVFHSVLRFLGVESPAYQPDLDLFQPKEK